jgi:hypothetical protein
MEIPYLISAYFCQVRGLPCIRELKSYAGSSLVAGSASCEEKKEVPQSSRRGVGTDNLIFLKITHAENY